MLDKDIVARISAYEADELTYEQVVELFQELIDSGLLWHLQGSHQRRAYAFLRDGMCTLPAEESANEAN